MPKARDLADLNAQLLAACREDERRQIAGRSQPVAPSAKPSRFFPFPVDLSTPTPVTCPLRSTGITPLLR
jgi:hypothetical protein